LGLLVENTNNGFALVMGFRFLIGFYLTRLGLLVENTNNGFTLVMGFRFLFGFYLTRF
jgi:hypothetical protein